MNKNKDKTNYLQKNDNLVNFVKLQSKFRTLTIEKIEAFLNISNRCARDKISEMAIYLPIISLSQEKGYELLENFGNLNNKEIEINIEKIDHQINDYLSRIYILNRRMEPLIEYKKNAQKFLRERKDIK